MMAKVLFFWVDSDQGYKQQRVVQVPPDTAPAGYRDIYALLDNGKCLRTKARRHAYSWVGNSASRMTKSKTWEYCDTPEAAKVEYAKLRLGVR